MPQPEVALPTSDVLRAPLLQVLVDGATLSGVLSARVRSSGTHACDTFEVAAATSADPVFGPAFWAEATGILIDVQASRGDGFISLVLGYADSVVLDPLQGVVQISGRDLSAALIEAPTQETFANQTASEIAALLAGRHGLGALVQPTTTPVGRYWQLEHDHITLNQFSRATTEWDLLVALAEREGFDVWVTGSTLNFQPPATALLPTAVLRPVATVNGPANVESLKLERSLTLASGLTVVVKSWNSRMAQGFTQQASSSGPGARASRSYNFVLPNLTPDVALQIAQQRLDELSRHERIVTAEMPGDLLLDAHAAIALEGTGTAFDQVYQVDELERGLDVRRGFRQRVRARNVTLAQETL